MYAAINANEGMGFEKFSDKGNSIVPMTSQSIAPAKYIYDIIPLKIKNIH